MSVIIVTVFVGRDRDRLLLRHIYETFWPCICSRGVRSTTLDCATRPSQACDCCMCSRLPVADGSTVMRKYRFRLAASCHANGLLHTCPRMSMHTHQNCCCCRTSQAVCHSAAAMAGIQQQAMLQANLSAGPSTLLRHYAQQALCCQPDHRTEQLPQLLLPAICWPAQLQHHPAARCAVHPLLARSPPPNLPKS
jgi:hypothetical protein